MSLQVVRLQARRAKGRLGGQESRQFGQIQLRFIAEETDGIAEIAAQSANDTAPQKKEPQ